MRRLLLGLLVGLLVFGAGTAGAKLANVTNPMSTDLDGNGHNITNVQAIYAGNIVSSGLLAAGSIQLATDTTGNGPGILAGDTDPSIGNLTPMPVGSLYLRSNGEWWRKTGSAFTAWTCEIGCAP